MIKNIVITGASRGIGYQIANYLSSNKSYQVINISRKKNKNPKIKNYLCDIGNYVQVKKTFKKIKNIDILINNSGITKFSLNPIKNFDKIIKTNLNGFFYCSHEALRLLKDKKDSSIINISSINAYQAFPNNPGYVLKIGANVPRIADHTPLCFTKISARFHISFAFTNTSDTGTNPAPV